MPSRDDSRRPRGVPAGTGSTSLRKPFSPKNPCLTAARIIAEMNRAADPRRDKLAETIYGVSIEIPSVVANRPFNQRRLGRRVKPSSSVSLGFSTERNFTTARSAWKDWRSKRLASSRKCHLLDRDRPFSDQRRVAKATSRWKISSTLSFCPRENGGNRV